MMRDRRPARATVDVRLHGLSPSALEDELGGSQFHGGFIRFFHQPQDRVERLFGLGPTGGVEGELLRFFLRR